MAESAAGAREELARRSAYAIAAAFFVLYSGYSLRRHHLLRTTGYDLGIFEQAVRAYSRFQAPIIPLKGPGVHVLGDHFHPILVTLAPFYRIWPGAQTLLVAQALLIALSIVPVARLAVGRLGVGVGLWLSAAYALSWGIQGALGFDFHEIAFAVPLLAFAMVALAERRWRAAVAWTLPLLLVKEDMGLLVAAIGGYLIWRGQRRSGAALVVAGLAAVALTVKVVLPFFNDGRFSYSAYLDPDKDLWSLALSFPAGLFENPRKLVLLALLLLLTGGAALRTPLALVAVPVLLSRLVSTNPVHWEVGRVHYNAVLMPILFVALIEVLPALRADGRLRMRIWRRTAIVFPGIFALMMHLTPWGITNPNNYADTPHYAAARRVLAKVPDGVAVAAGNSVAPHLTGRCRVVIFPPSHGERVDWVVTDTRVRTIAPKTLDQESAARAGLWPPTAEQVQAALRALPSQGFTKVAEDDGVVLYRRTAAAP
ncbi:DUF2079 domain-containing protein [Actinomadura miaoliensis]|uniref:DUF2079 domain-containing protein n=1 Tax=Actinomadura miaoliensis TaxID=430685 RepID=A0ABP7VG78_9ACTN